MAVERIRGEQVLLRLVRDGVLQRELDELKSLEWTVNVSILTEGFLGRTTEEKDEIYRGTSGSIEFQPRSLQAWEVLDFIARRAQRRTSPAGVINLSFVGLFPNGDKPRILVPDIKFQDPGLRAPGRDQYVTAPWQWQASDFVYRPA
jgi:hypothetical protein